MRSNQLRQNYVGEGDRRRMGCSPDRTFVVTRRRANLPRIPHDLRHIELRFRKDSCEYTGDVERLPKQDWDELRLENQPFAR